MTDETTPETEHPEDPPSPPEFTLEDVRQLLAWCRDNPVDEKAFPVLVELREKIVDPSVAAEAIEASRAVSRVVIENESPSPADHAHMTILLASLLQVSSRRDDVDKIFEAWLRNPTSFGPRPTPPAFQKAEFIQRIADMLGWGTLEVARDRDPLQRFLAWVDGWVPKHKYKVRRTMDLMRRNFPSQEVWKAIRFS